MISWSKARHVLAQEGLTLPKYVELVEWAGAAARLYAVGANRWVAEGLDGLLYDFPAIEDGWEQRKPYAGTPSEASRTEPWHAIGTGWPVVDRAALAKAMPS